MASKTEPPHSPLRRILFLQGLLVFALVVFLWPAGVIEPATLFLSAIFMGANFLLLGYGIRWLLAPFASKRRLGLGIGLLVVKLALFLGMVSALFMRAPLHAPSFAVGISSLLAAILMERVWFSPKEAD
jgi:hypothetical protein